jgi:hypothetical protein
MVKVENLSTGQVLEYTLSPAQAVVAAYEQSRGNWNTWSYPDPANHPQFEEGVKTVRCGDWCVIKVDTGKPLVSLTNEQINEALTMADLGLLLDACPTLAAAVRQLRNRIASLELELAKTNDATAIRNLLVEAQAVDVDAAASLVQMLMSGADPPQAQTVVKWLQIHKPYLFRREARIKA